ncbi:MAG: CBS domain-containing protein [archaeon]
MKTGVKIYEVMTTKPVTVSQDTKIIDCAKKMKEHQIGSLLVKEGKMVVGIITEDDFVRKVVAENIDLETPVKEVMIKKVITIQSNKDIYEAIKIMAKEGIKQLPVTEEGKLMGMLTWKDILTVQPQLFDVFIEKAHVNEQTEEREGTVGRCEMCSNLTELREVEGKLICKSCEKGL